MNSGVRGSGGSRGGKYLKILHIINYYMPDMGYQENYLPFYQSRLGHDVYIITSDRYYSFDDYDRLFYPSLGERVTGTGKFRVGGVDIIRLRTRFENTGHDLLKMDSADLMDNMGIIAPDVIHVHDYKNLNVITAINYAKKNGCRLYLDCHSDSVNSLAGKKFLRKIVYSGFNRAIYRVFVGKHIRSFIAINEASKRFLSENFGIDKSNISINRLGVDVENMKFSKDERTKIRKALGIKERHTVIVNSGKIRSDLHADILDSFKNMSHGRDDIKLLFIGYCGEDMKRKIKNEKDVIYAGCKRHDELASYYSASDISVWPQPTISILDAMACGLPTVIRDDESTAYLKDSGGCMVFADAGEMRHHLKKLADNVEQRADMSRKAAEYIKSNLSWTEIARESISIYSN